MSFVFSSCWTRSTRKLSPYKEVDYKLDYGVVYSYCFPFFICFYFSVSLCDTVFSCFVCVFTTTGNSHTRQVYSDSQMYECSPFSSSVYHMDPIYHIYFKYVMLIIWTSLIRLYQRYLIIRRFYGLVFGQFHSIHLLFYVLVVDKFERHFK